MVLDIEPASVPPHTHSSKEPHADIEMNSSDSNFSRTAQNHSGRDSKRWQDSPNWKKVKSKIPAPIASLIFGVILSKDSLPRDNGGLGAPVRLSCTARLWPGAQSCGLEGVNCLPFDDSSFAFSCPADCAGVQVLNPYAIGDASIVYRPLIVGGAPEESEGNELVYRGDSFICGAAIQAGVLTDTSGGCGVVNLLGEKTTYGSHSQNGLTSVGFNSSFPMSFDFNQSAQILSDSAKCRDPRWDLLTLSTIFTAVFSLFTTHPLTFFGPVFVITFWQVAMASDPPSYSDYPSLGSTALANFLPAAFIAVIIYQVSVRKTLTHLNAQYEKTVLWVGALWVGALNSLTLDMIPISRLTGHDLKQQPGAITALVIIILILVAVVLYQAWCFRVEGRLPRYLGIYAVLAFCLLILLAVPSENLRIHHYILGLLLLPGTATQTRISLLCQGLLVGLFINGVARWGFASILQTAAALRGDAQLGTGLVSILEPVINSTSITFAWEGLARGYEGVSVLVNDVERFRGFHKDGDNNFTWTRQALDHPEYFRFGFVNYQPFGGITYSDFTRAGTWWPNGTWDDPPPGRT
ncbi:uncharacterized protein N0V89_012473 [Didymosphaeria variabile]|uniref:LCCL domain-containing protein n=1 Tax=Didymosphaeria variabile TaxID=1932322 RepID=A0A9W9C517_9PLEO|nr:uncharacterized protein N0V89_012473 [Didymosphaeria variabile]KAJ4344729.1 hypothetical protein N0V89_012473 [Didymosphaeria variabile]